ncbi:hypothetical protein ACOBR2_02635 [Telmatobacter bradus]|uniref:hypothetical protein n=1 Tax=Telmatobacter bradus TaxID=474953 RepID=UPI003B437E9C
MTAPSISSEQRNALLGRILASPQFVRSPKLSAFLRCICELESQGLASQINEQRIGVTVFGRKEGYSVGDDSIVRSQARFLRLHLEEYFTREGSSEPFLLSIPKGSYVPVFQKRPEESPQTSADTTKAPQDAPQTTSRLQHILFIFFFLALLTGVLSLFVFHAPWLQNLHKTSEQRFWESVFDSRRRPIIVPSDSSLVLLEAIAGHTVPLDDYMNRRYLNELPDAALKSTWQTVAISQYTSLADLTLVSRLQQQPTAIASGARIRFARYVAMKELKESNAVLIGGLRSNPWVALYMPVQKMSIEYDQQRQLNFVWNRSHGSGEQERYYESGNNSAHTAFGMIAYLPSLDGQGTALIVGGTSKAGTEAAGEYLFNKNFASFLQQLGNGGTPPHFELLIATDNLNGESSNVRMVCFHRLN